MIGKHKQVYILAGYIKHFADVFIGKNAIIQIGAVAEAGITSQIILYATFFGYFH